MKLCLIASLIARESLKAHGSCNQVQNNHTDHEFNYDLHNLSLIRVTISRGLPRWKLEMHMADKNTPYTLYLFILSPIITYPYLFWVGRGKKQIPRHVFSHHLETPQAIYKAENSMTLRYILNMSEFVSPNTICTFGPKLRTINQRGGGSIYFWKGLFTGSPKI